MCIYDHSRSFKPFWACVAICLGSIGAFSAPAALPADPIITEEAPPERLNTDAQTAVALAPDWLREDLRDNLALLDDQHQTTYANLILFADESRFTDEIAFCVANLAPEILNNPNFLPELIEENVFYVYEHDQYLDYVRIVDYGVPGDESYYSTTVYRVEENGIESEYELDRDMYYWLIVHPKIEDERADYCDPDSPMGPHADPPVGVFWRDWLFNHTEPIPDTTDYYPVLKDAVTGIDTLWKNKVNNIDNGAVGAITQWILDVLDFGSGAERPIQPVRIYKLHLGRCGEHQDFASAAARSCLIPCLNSNAIGEDHVWNEFWDRRYIHWEPVNVYMDDPLVYEEGWGTKDFSGVENIFGDGYTFSVLERYSRDICHVNVVVEDQNHERIDGARVILKRGAGGASVWGHTGSDGELNLKFGDTLKCRSRIYLNDITFPQDDFYTIADSTVPDGSYSWTATLPVSLPALQVTQVTEDSIDSGYRLVISYTVNGEVLWGLYPYDSGNHFSRRVTGGDIDCFILDESNYELYQNQTAFQSPWVDLKSTSNQMTFDFPSIGSWYCVISAERKFKCKQLVSVSISIEKWNQTDWEEIDRVDRDLELFPGERYVTAMDIPATLGVKLKMPSYLFQAGDDCYLKALIGNPDAQQTNIPLFVILQVFDTFYFHPDWTDTVAYQYIDLVPGITQMMILPQFQWPDNVGTASGMVFYGGMTTPDFSELLGDFSMWEFGWM